MENIQTNQINVRYIRLDILRVICCAAVLLYHTGILRGGFFAVCTFFVLTGYLSVKSAFRQERFNILKHYLKRLLHIYLPLLVVVLITVGVISLLPQIRWLNLKPETTSVLLGYNNFWQIAASQDYFARHTDSPFIHFWYIGILLQFELIFPIVFVVLKFIGKKISRALACLIPLAVCAASFVFFSRLIAEGRITEAYYHSMARAFAPFLGVVLGLAEEYWGPMVPKALRGSSASAWVFGVYLVIFAAINCALDSSFKYLALLFLVVTLISARLVSYAGVSVSRHEKAGGFKVLSLLANVSYEIYLVQYPIIFLCAELFSQTLSEGARCAAIIISTILIALLMHYGLYFRKGQKPAGLKIATLIVLLLATAGGGYYFSVAEDHTQELAELEQRLEENAREMEARQQAIAEQSRNDEDKWTELLQSFDGGEEKVLEAVRQMRVVCIGDSVMLGALDELMKTFPNGWFDAKKSRTAWVLPDILGRLNNDDLMGDIIVVNFGANGDSPYRVKETAMDMLAGKKVYWLTNTNPKTDNSNTAIYQLAEQYDNLTIVDWLSISSGHPDWFFADGMHLTEEGRKAFAKTIVDAISDPYINEWRQKKAQAEAEYETYRSQMVSFFGNDLLTNVYPLIQEDYAHASFRTYEQFDTDALLADMKTASGSMTLADKVLLLLDATVEITQDELRRIKDFCGERTLWLVTPGRTAVVAADGSLTNVKTWKPQGGKMFMADDVHLTPQGNEALRKALLDLGLVVAP
ncbi:MAG: acyltransferase [Firmicutes bacterium]|nr:acyltransferase [Bacillota bacterium]